MNLRLYEFVPTSMDFSASYSVYRTRTPVKTQPGISSFPDVRLFPQGRGSVLKRLQSSRLKGHLVWNYYTAAVSSHLGTF